MQQPEATPPVAASGPRTPTSLWDRWRNRDHTQGSLLASLVILSLPSVLTSVAGGAAFQLFELKFLGALGATAIAAVGATNQTVRQFSFLIVMGLSIVAQMMIARMVGEGRVDQAEHAAGQSLVLGGILALVFALIGGLFPEALLGLIIRDPETITFGAPYVRLTFVLFFGQILGMMFGSILTGAGDTTTPMLITFVTTPIAIIAEWCLMFGHLGAPAFGISGVALGVAIGSVASVSISLWVLFSGRCRVHVRREHLAPDAKMLGALAKMSWQPAIHMLARVVIVFYFMWLAGRLGTHVQAAYTIGLRLEMVGFMIGFPIANACSTLVGQGLGAGDPSRAWRAVRIGMAAEVSFFWVFAAAVIWLRTDIVAFFTDDPRVIPIAAEYLWYSAAAFTFYGLYFIAFRALQASGDMASPMLISLGCALFAGAPIGYILSARPEFGPTGMWIANLTYTVINTVITVGWLLTGRWTRRAMAGIG